MSSIDSNDDEWLNCNDKHTAGSSSSLRDLLLTQQEPSMSLDEEDLSCISISDDDNLYCQSSPNKKAKRVSFGTRVEIREYNVIQGDHPACAIPLALDWGHSDSIYVNTTTHCPSRLASYTPPKRLSLEDRRQKLFGSVADNLQDFAAADAELEAMIQGLDDCIAEATNFDDVELPTELPTFSFPMLPPSPEPLYGGCFAFSPQELSHQQGQEKGEGVPMIQWQRVTS